MSATSSWFETWCSMLVVLQDDSRLEKLTSCDFCRGRGWHVQESGLWPCDECVNVEGRWSYVFNHVLRQLRALSMLVEAPCGSMECSACWRHLDNTHEKIDSSLSGCGVTGEDAAVHRAMWGVIDDVQE